MGQTGSKGEPPLTQEQINLSNRKCAAFVKGLKGCRKANGKDAAVACKNLEMRVITCYAEDHCPEQFAEHRKCYNKLYTTGIYKGLGHCIPYEDAMKACLKKKGLFPV